MPAAIPPRSARRTVRRRVLTVAVLAAVATFTASQFADGATPYEAEVQGDSPGVYYRVNEPQGALFATDISTTDTTKRRNAHYSGGQLGQPGATTDGDKAVKDVTMTSSFTDEDEHTVEFWIKDAAQASQTLMLHGIDQLTTQGTVGSGWQLYTYESGGTHRLAIILGGQDVDLPCAAPSGSGWQHYLISWSADTVNCYLNGSGAGPVTTPNPIQSIAATPTFVVSARGTVDEIALYQATLTETTAAAHYHTALRPFSTSAPTINGDRYEGRTLTTTSGGWRGENLAFSHQWYRCTSTASTTCTPIIDATATTYTPTAGDVGAYLQTKVRAENEHGAVIRASAIVGPIGPAREAPNPYSLAVAASAPRLYYRFTETTGSPTARNWATTGAAYDGTYSAGERGVAGPLNLADTAVSSPVLSASAALDENAVEFFARAAAAPVAGDQPWISHGNVSGTTPIDGWVLYRDDEDHLLHFAYRFAVPGGLEVPAADIPLPCAPPAEGLDWGHLVVDWSRVVDNHRVIECHVDGKAHGETDLVGNWALPPDLYKNRPLTISAPATIDEFATYTSLSAAQALAHSTAAEAARAEVNTPAISGVFTTETGAPASGVAAIFISPFEAYAEEPPDGAEESLELLAAANLSATGSYSMTPAVTPTVRNAAALNNGIVNLTLVVRGLGYAITLGMPMKLVGDQLHSTESGSRVGSSDITMSGSTSDDSPGLVLQEDTGEKEYSTTEVSAAHACRHSVIQTGKAFMKTGESHSWTGQGVRFGYAQERREESVISIAIKRSNSWGLAGDVSRSRSVAAGFDDYKPERRATRYSTEWTFKKYRHTGVCGHYDTINPGTWTGGNYDYGIERILDGQCSTVSPGNRIATSARHFYRLSNKAVTYSNALSVFGVDVFTARSGHSTNVKLTWTNSDNPKVHYLCGASKPPLEAPIVYSGY